MDSLGVECGGTAAGRRGPGRHDKVWGRFCCPRPPTSNLSHRARTGGFSMIYAVLPGGLWSALPVAGGGPP